MINNVYELPNIEPSIRYPHGAAGFPTKATWLKDIRKVSYPSWPLVNVKNVSKYFPESEETQKGHMKSQRQGVRSTKTQQSTRALPMPIVKRRIFSSHSTIPKTQSTHTRQVNSRMPQAADTTTR